MNSVCPECGEDEFHLCPACKTKVRICDQCGVDPAWSHTLKHEPVAERAVCLKCGITNLANAARDVGDDATPEEIEDGRLNAEFFESMLKPRKTK